MSGDSATPREPAAPQPAERADERAANVGQGSAGLRPDSTIVPVFFIRPSRGLVAIDLRELWERRELIYFLAWRDVKVRYKQTVLGAFWAILQPLLAMVVFGVVFGRLAKVPSDGSPYPLFVLVALLPWTFFANALHQAGNSLVASQTLITKVYFPRLVVPLAAVLSGTVDLGVSLVVLGGILAVYARVPGPEILVLAPALVLAFAAALSIGLWLSALNARFRDVRHAIPFLVQLWMFASPVVYPTSMIPLPWRWLYAANPMVGVIEAWRFALLGTGELGVVLVSSASTFVLLFSGAIYFRWSERTLVDVV